MSQRVRVRIGNLFSSYINGYSFKSEDFEITRTQDMLPVLKIANVGVAEKTDFTNCHYHKTSGFERFIAHRGDLAFSLTGSLGYVSIVTEDCLVNQRVFVIRREKEYSQLLDVIQPFIKSLDFTNYCYSKATSESNKNISFSVIMDYEVAVFVNDDGSFDLERQRALAQKYQDVEEKKKSLMSKMKILQEHKIAFDRDQSLSYTHIKLNEMVVHKNGKASYTKEYCQRHNGKYPVYSAKNNGPIAYLNNADYSGSFLTYSKNGCAGYITIINGEFSVNGDRCVLQLEQGYENVDLSYLKYYLEPLFRANIKGRMGINGKNEYTKINSTMIKQLNIEVPIPTRADGSFDLSKQQELANKYAEIESIKQSLSLNVQHLLNVSVTD